jgi:hypothetical protein
VRESLFVCQCACVRVMLMRVDVYSCMHNNAICNVGHCTCTVLSATASSEFDPVFISV